jgi:lipoate---protein ligase
MGRMRGRVIVSGISDPAFVMALDETFQILAVSDPQRLPVLHFYRKTPSISLGYFQSVSDAVDRVECQKQSVGIFRRKSGGGTIYEDRDQLIYGLTLPRPDDHGVPTITLDSFRFLNSPLISTLRDFGFPAEYVPVNDILVNGRKVSGCAQTRSGGVLLQHGTLIFRHDPTIMFSVLRVPEGKIADRGLQNPADRVTSLMMESNGTVPMETGPIKRNPVDSALGALLNEPSMDAAMDMVRMRLISHFSETLGIRFSVDSITGEELGMAEDLAATKYRNDAWTYRR